VARPDQRIATALQALATLDELADLPADKIVRNAAIQRFEYTFEAAWKAAQAVLLDRFGVELASPKPVVRASLENGLLTVEEARIALAMVDHRNLTAHTYNEELANEIFTQIPFYSRLLRAWLERLVKT
jgi:nucleotidyltransferase substrate binding protein (TIGR01987 family)